MKSDNAIIIALIVVIIVVAGAYFFISANGIGQSQDDQIEEPVLQEHLGLINTYRRLFYYSHGSIHMNLYNQNGAVVELTQELPDPDTDTDSDTEEEMTEHV